jgi:hypothetical protein
MGKIFDLKANYSGLKYLFVQPSLNSIQSRWFEFLNDYEFDIKNILGKENKVVDALNRRVHEIHSTVVSM